MSVSSSVSNSRLSYPYPTSLSNPRPLNSSSRVNWDGMPEISPVHSVVRMPLVAWASGSASFTREPSLASSRMKRDSTTVMILAIGVSGRIITVTQRKDHSRVSYYGHRRKGVGLEG